MTPVRIGSVPLQAPLSPIVRTGILRCCSNRRTRLPVGLTHYLPHQPPLCSTPALLSRASSCPSLSRRRHLLRACIASVKNSTKTLYSALVSPAQPCRALSAGDNKMASHNLMLVSDLDLTMVDHKDPSHASLLNFNCLWAAEYAYNSLLVYSTGRSWQRYLELIKDTPLLTPAALILSVGTQIRVGASLKIDMDWERALDDGWNRDIIVEEAMKFPSLRFQEEPDQGPHKVSFKVEKGTAEDLQQKLSARLLERGLKVKLLYSSGIDLDVLPYKAGKGQALAYLLSKMAEEGFQQKNILVCGDSGNDIDLFTVDGVHGVIVSNAHEELIQWHQLHGSSAKIFRATQRCAGGIMDALQHFGFGPHLSPFDRINSKYVPSFLSIDGGSVASLGSALKEVVEFNVLLMKWFSGDVPNTEEIFRRLIGVIRSSAKVVYPWGIESSLAESIVGVRQKHGSMQGSGTRIWFDNMHGQSLNEGAFLVTWQYWEQRPGGERRGYFASAVLVAKDGTPNGVEWLHLHETSRREAS